MLKSIAPIALLPPMPMHCKKLVMPKTAPIAAPPAGPSVIAAIATGITLNVIASGPIFRYPRGVYAISRRMPVIRPKMTSLDVLFVVFMKFSSLLLFPFEKPAAPFVRQTVAYLRQYHVHKILTNSVLSGDTIQKSCEPGHFNSPSLPV